MPHGPLQLKENAECLLLDSVSTYKITKAPILRVYTSLLAIATIGLYIPSIITDFIIVCISRIWKIICA